MAGKNGSSAANTAQTGTFRVPLDKPEMVGEISVTEAAEIKARTDLAKTLMDKVKTLQDEVTSLSVMRQIAENERSNYMRLLMSAHGLNDDDEYAVNPDTGLIHRTAKSTPPTAVVEQSASESDESTVGATPGG